MPLLRCLSSSGTIVKGEETLCRGIADGIFLRGRLIWILPESCLVAPGGLDGRFSGMLFRGGGPSIGQCPAA
jgi:hypothetical protein